MNEDKYPLDPRISELFPRSKIGSRVEPNSEQTTFLLDQLLEGQLRYNVRSLTPNYKDHRVDPRLRKCPKGIDVDLDSFPRLIKKWFGWCPKNQTQLTNYVIGEALLNPYDPVKSYLDSLPAMDANSIDFLMYQEQLIELLFNLKPEVGHHNFYQQIIKLWAISAVARVYQPGCKVDSILVLKGKQGMGKSTFFSALAGQAFTELHYNPMKPENSLMVLHKHWIVELAEMGRLINKKSADELKHFISNAEDSLRLPYGRSVKNLPRRGVLCGTVNDSTFLNDPTGSRRFMVIPLADDTVINTDYIADSRDKLWAYFKTLYQLGHRWHLTKAEEALLSELNQAHELESEYTNLIESLLGVYESIPVLWGQLEHFQLLSTTYRRETQLEASF